jgi:hypothetical protein
MAEKQELTMDERIDKAVSDLLASSFRSGTPPKADEALKLSQAVLNLAHAKIQMIHSCKK